MTITEQEGQDVVDEKGVFWAEGGERLKENVEDTASSGLTTATCASLTTSVQEVERWWQQRRESITCFV